MWPFYNPMSPSSGSLPVPSSGFSLSDWLSGQIPKINNLPVPVKGGTVGGLGQMILGMLAKRGGFGNPYLTAASVAGDMLKSTPANQGEVPQYVKSPYGYIRNSADTSTLAKPENNASGVDEAGMAMAFPGVPMPRPRPPQVPLSLAPPAQGQAPFNLNPFAAAPMGGPGSMSFGAGDGPSGDPQAAGSDILSMLMKKLQASRGFGSGSGGAIY